MALRALPCKNCESPLMVVGRPTASLKDGTPYVIGRAPSRFPFRVPCAKCQRVTTVTAADFNMLPAMSMAHLEEHELLAPMLKDLKGAGHDETQARDLFAAGWSPAALDALPKQESGDGA